MQKLLQSWLFSLFFLSQNHKEKEKLQLNDDNVVVVRVLAEYIKNQKSSTIKQKVSKVREKWVKERERKRE